VSPPGTTFSWTFGDGSTSTSSTTASANYTSAGSYSVVLVATAGPCSDTASIVIVVTDGFTIEIPNVFTPNGDNVNDVFTISSSGVKEITLQIFNRWGQLMYDFNGAKAGWDGITNNGSEASAGTYFYFVKAIGFDGKEYEKKGSLNLFR
jgi:gliding motility-associated-like protein